MKMPKTKPARGASTAEAARHVGLGNTAFATLLNDGIVERQDRATGYNLTTVRLKCFAHLRSVAAGRGGIDSGEMLSHERALLAKEQREAMTLKNAISRGEYLVADVVKRMLTGTFTTMRERALTLPGKVADSLTPHCEEDRGVIGEILRLEVFELLEGLSDYKNYPPVAADKPKPQRAANAKRAAK
jgi:hypothetical protein